MDIQEKEWGSFVEQLKTKGVVKIGRNALGVITNLVREGSCSLGYNDIELMWETWQAAKAQAVPESRVSVEAHQIIIDEVKTEINEGYDLCQDSYLLDVLVNRGIQIGKAQAVPEVQQALHDRLLVKSIREHVESHIAEVSVNDLFDKGWLAAMKCIQNNIDILEAQEPAND